MHKTLLAGLFFLGLTGYVVVNHVVSQPAVPQITPAVSLLVSDEATLIDNLPQVRALLSQADPYSVRFTKTIAAVNRLNQVRDEAASGLKPGKDKDPAAQLQVQRAVSRLIAAVAQEEGDMLREQHEGRLVRLSVLAGCIAALGTVLLLVIYWQEKKIAGEVFRALKAREDALPSEPALKEQPLDVQVTHLIEKFGQKDGQVKKLTSDCFDRGQEIRTLRRQLKNQSSAPPPAPPPHRTTKTEEDLKERTGTGSTVIPFQPGQHFIFEDEEEVGRVATVHQIAPAGGSSVLSRLAQAVDLCAHTTGEIISIQVEVSALQHLFPNHFPAVLQAVIEHLVTEMLGHNVAAGELAVNGDTLYWEVETASFDYVEFVNDCHRKTPIVFEDARVRAPHLHIEILAPSRLDYGT